MALVIAAAADAAAAVAAASADAFASSEPSWAVSLLTCADWATDRAFSAADRASSAWVALAAAEAEFVLQAEIDAARAERDHAAVCQRKDAATRKRGTAIGNGLAGEQSAEVKVRIEEAEAAGVARPSNRDQS